MMKLFSISVSALILLLLFQLNHGVAAGFSDMSAMMPSCGGEVSGTSEPQEKCVCCFFSQADRANGKSLSGKTNFLPAMPGHHPEKHLSAPRHIRTLKGHPKFHNHHSWLKTVVQQK